MLFEPRLSPAPSSLLDPSAKEPFHFLGRIPVASLEEMTIGVHCQFDRGVPEPLRNLFGMDPLIDEKRGVRVAQIVEPELRELVLFANHLKATKNIALFERRPNFGREQKAALAPAFGGEQTLFPRASLILNEEIDQEGSRSHLCDDASSRELDRQLAVLQIDIFIP